MVGAANTAIGDIQGAQTAGQGYINTGRTAANDILSQVNNLNAALAPGGSLTSQFSFDPTQIANNPDYQFQLQQGTQAVQRAAAANGTLQSGGTMKALDQFSQGLASNEIGQAYNQAFNTFQGNRQNNMAALQLPLNVGLAASPLSQSAFQNYGNTSGANLTRGAEDLANLGTSGAAQIADQLTNIGQAKAAGSLKQGQIWSSFAKGAAGGLSAFGAPLANATGGNPAVAGVWNAAMGGG